MCQNGYYNVITERSWFDIVVAIGHGSDANDRVSGVYGN